MEGEIKAELHCHSFYSKGEKIIVEGLNTPEEIIRHAKKIGLGCIAITDHNTTKGIERAKKEAKKQNIILIRGEEISTREGHLIALGIQEEIKPKISLEEALDNIHRQGGIGIAPHPFDLKGVGLEKLSKKCDAVEIFNALNIDRFANRRAEKFFDDRPHIAGSDAHWTEMMGYGLTIFKDCFNEDDCLKAIKRKKVRIEKKYIPIRIITEWSIKRINYSHHHIINYMNDNYSYPKRFIGKKMLELTKKSPGNIDYLFEFFAFLGFGFAIFFSFFINWVVGNIKDFGDLDVR